MLKLLVAWLQFNRQLHALSGVFPERLYTLLLHAVRWAQ